jgi:CoA:oxalate CoA-transferase
MTSNLRQDTPRLPLAGVRVVDFSRLLPGPWCTQMLGDLGAEVIKVEQPGIGDFSRHNPPNYRAGSAYFNSVNRHKRSLAVDLSRNEGRKVAHRLIDWADVVVESFRLGVPAKLGIDYETSRKLNERVIYCSITGFGQSGPYAAIPGHDLVVQAASGVVGVAAENGKASVPGFQAADYAAANYAVMGILAALYRRRDTGSGCFLDVSMFDSLISMNNIVLCAGMARAAGYEGGPTMQVWGANPRYATYVAKDRRSVAVSLLEARTWKVFCDVIGRPDLVSADETPSDRHTDHGERSALYRGAIQEYCARFDREELIANMLAANIPISPVSDPDEVMRDEHVVARKLIEWVDHPAEGRIPQLSNPLAMSGLADTRGLPAPSLGADSEAILADLGFTKDERVQMRRAGVIATSGA